MFREFTDAEQFEAAYFLQRVLAAPTEFHCHRCTLCRTMPLVWIALIAPDDINLEGLGATPEARFLPYALCSKCYTDDWSFVPAIERHFIAQALARRRPRLVLLPRNGNETNHN